jgi:hypothetical protein
MQMNFFGAPWNEPVIIRPKNGRPRTFHSVEEAFDFLHREWPSNGGEHYRRAIDVSRAALGRKTFREAARKAFIAACVEAGMPSVVFAAPPSKRSVTAFSKEAVMA